MKSPGARAGSEELAGKDGGAARPLHGESGAGPGQVDRGGRRGGGLQVVVYIGGGGRPVERAMAVLGRVFGDRKGMV